MCLCTSVIAYFSVSHSTAPLQQGLVTHPQSLASCLSQSEPGCYQESSSLTLHKSKNVRALGNSQ